MFGRGKLVKRLLGRHKDDRLRSTGLHTGFGDTSARESDQRYIILVEDLRLQHLAQHSTIIYDRRIGVRDELGRLIWFGVE